MAPSLFHHYHSLQYTVTHTKMHRRTGRGGRGGTCPPPVRPETLISRAISTLESGNLRYHVKAICSNLQKSIKKGTISSSKRGKWHLRDSTFQNFRGGECPRTPPTTLV